ncbi:hypothetical protein F5B20DRAFT_531572 [Whalleya microplaca]|nr:hypothetical protein F5B20DRAFT_531572 [Whalleya microplaca]
MGNQSSSQMVPGSEHPDAGTRQDRTSPPWHYPQSHSDNSLPSSQPQSPGIAFSSQYPASNSRIPPRPPGRHPKVEIPSSPPAPPPAMSPSAMNIKTEALSSPDDPRQHLLQPSSPATSHIKPSKSKKDRIKKRSSSVSRSDDRRPFIPHSSIDFDAPVPVYGNHVEEAFRDLDDTHSHDIDVNGADVASDTLIQKEDRKRKKKEAKQRRKAAKLERQRLEASASPAARESPSDHAMGSLQAPSTFATITDSIHPSFHPENAVDPTDAYGDFSSPKKSRKNKRKARDQLEIEDDPNQLPTPDHEPTLDQLPATNGNSATPNEMSLPSRKRKLADSDGKQRKKHKRAHNKKKATNESHGYDEISEDAEEPLANDTVFISQSSSLRHNNKKSSKAPVDVESSFSGLAESLYADRKKEAGLAINQDESADEQSRAQSTSEERISRDPSVASGSNINGVEIDSEQATHPDATSDDEMDIDASTKAEPLNDDASSYNGETHANVEITSSDPDSELVDRVRDGDQDQMEVDGDEQSDEEPEDAQESDANEDIEDASGNELAEAAPSPGYDSANGEYQPDDEEPLEGSGDEDSNIGGAKMESPEAEEESLPAAVGRPDSDINMANGDDLDNDEVEVPSSVPYANSAPFDTDIGGHKRSQSGSTRKRFAKLPFYSRTPAGATENSHEQASPAAAAASRRGPSQQHKTELDDNVSAGPSNAAQKGKRRQPKISTMLKGKTEDSPDPEPSLRPNRQIARQKLRPEEIVKGPFSEFEIRNISQAVERWRDDHEMTQFQINELIQGTPREMKSSEFWDYVSATCANRKRQKVINQCRRKYHNFVARATWTPEQQEELKDMYEKHGNKYALIGKLINRHPEDVRDRIRNYVVCGDKRRTDPWDQGEIDMLTNIVLEAIEAIQKHHADKGTVYPGPEDDLVDWQIVSEKMGRTRSRLQCIQKWKTIKAQIEGGSVDGEILSVDEIVQRARDEAAEMLSRDRYRIVKAVRACDVNADSRIPWAKIKAKKLHDQWSRPTLMLVWYRLKLSIPDWKTMTVPQIADQLLAQYRETRELAFPDDVDPGGEYAEIEHKVKKIMKFNRAPKSPYFVVKSEDDGDDSAVEDEGQEEDEDEDGFAQDAALNERGSSIDLGLSMKAINEDGLDEDDPSEIEDSEPDVKVQLSNRQHNARASVDPESSDAPSISDFILRKPTGGGKVYGTSNKVATSPNITPENYKRIAMREHSEPGDGGRYSAQKLSGRKKKAARRSQSKYEDIDDPSSDTNASDVESIPAH